METFHEQVAIAKMFGPTAASIHGTAILYKVLGDVVDDALDRKFVYATHDDAEDVDDADAIGRYFKNYKKHTFHVVLVGGYYTPQQRLAYLKKLFPQLLADTEFGVKIQNVTFYAEGSDIPSVAYDMFLHCSPCSEATFAHGVKNLKPGGRAMLVGSSKHGGFTNSINQRDTATMTANKETWDAKIAMLHTKGCMVVGIDADFSRNVNFPNPAKFPAEHPFSIQSIRAISPDLLALYFNVALRFLVSRPTNLPSAVIKRINEANARVFAVIFESLLSQVEESDLTMYLLYKAECLKAGIELAAIEPAILCFGIGSKLGVKYVPGVFCIDPKDHVGRETISCITNVDEVMPKFMAEAGCLIPAYDTMAAALAFSSEEDLALCGLF
jgi:hypothetical protein